MGPAFVVILLGVSVLCQVALGADAPSGAETTAPSTGVAIALAIAYFSRRLPIGGWLLYYYMQLYVSALFSLLFVPTIIGNLSPDKWDTSASYVWYVLSVVPQEIGILIEVVLATILLRKRNEALVQQLRQVLLALVAIYTATFCIDYLQPTDPVNAAFATIGLFNAMIWCAYFHRSKRVEQVFVYQNWLCLEELLSKPTPQENRYRLKRAAISSGVAFVIAMLLFGVVQKGDTKPDPVVLFVVPAFYAFVAFVISWAIPISHRKRLEFCGSHLPTTPK